MVGSVIPQPLMRQSLRGPERFPALEGGEAGVVGNLAQVGTGLGVPQTQKGRF